jgi:hypothetical protein
MMETDENFETLVFNYSYTLYEYSTACSVTPGDRCSISSLRQEFQTSSEAYPFSYSICIFSLGGVRRQEHEIGH